MNLKRKRLFKFLVWIITLSVLVCSLIMLESERVSVAQYNVSTDAGPVTVFEHASGSDGPLVFVTHGFAGSQQMMQYISRYLARSGYKVAAFDFFGHGRNTALLSPDVSRIEGTTAQLVSQTNTIIDTLRRQQAVPDRAFALLGHSMATDIIIRAAADFDGADSLVTISMYSDAVTAEFPNNLLILSGQWENRLREVGLRLIAQVDPNGVEGETVRAGDVLRRSVSVPFTEHVAVLYSSVTLQESRDWLDDTLGTTKRDQTAVRGYGVAILGALVGVVALFVLTVKFTSPPITKGAPVSLVRFLSALVLPSVLACGVAFVAPAELLGMSSFGTLLAFLFVWGAAQLLCVGKIALSITRPSLAGIAVLLAGAGFFAFALDRYAAAFVPTGVRWSLLVALLPATLIFAVADRMVVVDASAWRRLVARIMPMTTLGWSMVVIEGFGLLFTVVPVLCLYYLVFGTMGRPVAQRFGPMTAGLALGCILAWSIAASTPLFAH